MWVRRLRVRSSPGYVPGDTSLVRDRPRPHIGRSAHTQQHERSLPGTPSNAWRSVPNSWIRESAVRRKSPSTLTLAFAPAREVAEEGGVRHRLPEGDNGLMWVIAARLNDGRRVYFSAAEERQGQSEWSPRIGQAESFDTEAEAAKAAAAFDTNNAAREYEVLRVAPK